MPASTAKSILISKGAEATLTKKKILGKWIVEKTRVPKPYRQGELDSRLRKERTVREARMLHAVKKMGVHTPLLYAVDLNTFTLYMEFLDAPRLKHALLDKMVSRAEKMRLCAEFGSQIGKLHANGIVHGDLTTSNALVRTRKKKNELVMIDFGLATNSRKPEDLAVDLVNLKKTFEATHSGFEAGWNEIQRAYLMNGGKKSTLEHMHEVESRIRYA